MNNAHLPIEKKQLKTPSEQWAETLHIDAIKNEYKKIDSDWLLVHYRIAAGLVLFAIGLEICVSFFVISSDLLNTTVGKYILKYIVAPACANLFLIIIATIIMRTKQLSQTTKVYAVSLIFVGVCFTLVSVHSIFSATYYLFVIAVMLTTIYANYRLTGITALTGIIATIISELLIWWDPDKLGIFSSTKQLINFLISLSVLIASALVSIIQIRYEIDKNDASIQKELERKQLHERLLTDDLTGVFSRKALHDAFQEIDAHPPESNYILAIVDLDKFKDINDSLGHHIGDSYLVTFANILKENSAQAEVYRYGGDEFCLLFRNAHMDMAIATCRQLRQQLSALTFDEYPSLKLTASFGLAAYVKYITAARLFVYADKAMYQAKKTENGICIYTVPNTYDLQDMA